MIFCDLPRPSTTYPSYPQDQLQEVLFMAFSINQVTKYDSLRARCRPWTIGPSPFPIAKVAGPLLMAHGYRIIPINAAKSHIFIARGLEKASSPAVSSRIAGPAMQPALQWMFNNTFKYTCLCTVFVDIACAHKIEPI